MDHSELCWQTRGPSPAWGRVSGRTGLPQLGSVQSVRPAFAQPLASPSAGLSSSSYLHPQQPTPCWHHLFCPFAGAHLRTPGGPTPQLAATRPAVPGKNAFTRSQTRLLASVWKLLAQAFMLQFCL